jgi:hypothetical protein
MQNVEIDLPPAVSLDAVERTIDSALTSVGLLVSLRGTLAKFPGCTHWHAKVAGQAGTLEVTLWPRERRAWLTFQSGRTAGWMAAKLPEFQRALSQSLTMPE